MTVHKTQLASVPGIETFMRAPSGTVEDLGEGMVAVAGVCYDLSCTARIGARFAPRAIRSSSGYYGGTYYRDETYQGEMVEITTGQRMKVPEEGKIIDVGDFSVFAVDWEETAESVRSSMYRIARTGALPVVFGGDHFVTYPLVEGFRDAITERSGGKTGYIQFSSRLDLGETNPVWGDVWRGATARRILDGGTVAPENMVWVGANGYVEPHELELVHHLGLKVFTLEDVRRDGIVSVAQQAADISGNGCDAVYLSVDFDVLDGAYVAGTGNTSFDGLSNVQLLKAIDVLRRTKVATLDLVGLNPLLERVAETGQRFASWLVVRFISEKVMV